jgi:hypothetical protein
VSFPVLTNNLISEIIIAKLADSAIRGKNVGCKKRWTQNGI